MSVQSEENKLNVVETKKLLGIGVMAVRKLTRAGNFSGTCHVFNHAKYAHRYLAEFFNRLSNLATMVPQLLHAAVTTNPIPLDTL